VRRGRLLLLLRLLLPLMLLLRLLLLLRRLLRLRLLLRRRLLLQLLCRRFRFRERSPLQRRKDGAAARRGRLVGAARVLDRFLWGEPSGPGRAPPTQSNLPAIGAKPRQTGPLPAAPPSSPLAPTC
jgi:hypothetical protein